MVEFSSSNIKEPFASRLEIAEAISYLGVENIAIQLRKSGKIPRISDPSVRPLYGVPYFSITESCSLNMLGRKVDE